MIKCFTKGYVENNFKTPVYTFNLQDFFDERDLEYKWSAVPS